MASTFGTEVREVREGGTASPYQDRKKSKSKNPGRHQKTPLKPTDACFGPSLLELPPAERMRYPPTPTPTIPTPRVMSETRARVFPESPAASPVGSQTRPDPEGAA
jgi:hypothetical protein